jgi:adenosylcobyric acid synthase
MGQTHILSGTGEPFLRIHLPGKKKSWLDGWSVEGGKVSGTYVHGILDSPGFRADVLNRLRRTKGLRDRKPRPGRHARFHQYNRLADHFEAHCDMDKILSYL